jgi:hypothetical protein
MTQRNLQVVRIHSGKELAVITLEVENYDIAVPRRWEKRRVRMRGQ